MTVNASSIVQHVTQITNWNNDTCQSEWKIIVGAKKIIVVILAHVFVRIIGMAIPI